MNEKKIIDFDNATISELLELREEFTGENKFVYYEAKMYEKISVNVSKIMKETYELKGRDLRIKKIARKKNKRR